MTETPATELTSAGFQLPPGDGFIRLGDDIIRNNADAAYKLFKKATNWRGAVPVGTDLNRMFGVENRGSWGIGEDSTGEQIRSLLNMPEFVQGQIQIGVNTTGFTTQVYFPWNRNYFYYRSQTSLAKPLFTEWAKVGRDTGKSIPNDTDLNSMFGDAYNGNWWLDNAKAGQIVSLKNIPEIKQGVLTVRSTGNGFTTQMIYTGNTIWFRPQTQLGKPLWGEWVNLQKIGDNAGLVRHAILEEELKREYDSVDGKAVPVAIIFDHGTNNFRDIALPKLREHNFSVTLALNSDMYNPASPRYAYDNATSWAEIDGWANVEIANHGKTHGTASTNQDLQNEILGGLEELKQNLPSKKILTWVQTGQANNSTWQGFANGLDAASWSKSEAGKLIYENHAASTGAVGVGKPALYDLNGSPRQGVFGFWVDTVSGIAAAKSAIETAKSQGKALIIRAHPEVWNTSGKSTTADIHGFLDWLKAQQDSGALKVMTFGQWSVSKTSSSNSVTVLDASALLPTIGLNYRSKIAVSGNSVTMTLNGRATESGISAGKYGELPPNLRPPIEVYAFGQSISGDGLRVLPDGSINLPTVEANAYFKVSVSWFI